jgi:hypothetical protein
MNWFRLYHDVLNDTKVQRLPIELRWRWIELLCVASKEKKRGTLPGMDLIAYCLRVSKGRAKQIVRELCDVGLIDRSEDGQGLAMHNWEERQRKSDSSAARVAAFRERHQNDSGNGPVTLQKRSRGREEERGEREEFVCVTHTREGDDLRDWQEAMAELQGDDACKLIAGMLGESAEVPSVAGLEAWRFIHAAHVIQGPDRPKTWEYFMGAARRARRREFDSWHGPPPDDDPSRPKGRDSPGRPLSEAQVERERRRQWAREA